MSWFERNEKLRTELENQIEVQLEAAKIRPEVKGGIFIDFDKLPDFYKACDQLYEYYRLHDDNTIGLATVSVYADFTRYLPEVISDEQFSEAIREQAQEMLDELQGWMDDLIIEARRATRQLRGKSN